MSEIDEMDAAEVRLWQQYLIAEPRGTHRDDWHSAQICHAIYTFMLGLSGGDSKKIKLQDCLLKFDDIDQTKTEEEKQKSIALQTAMGIMSAFGPENIPKKFERDIKKLASKNFDILNTSKSELED